MDTYGMLIPKEQQDMIWMVPYLNGVTVSISEKMCLKEYLKISPLSLNLPLQPFDTSSNPGKRKETRHLTSRWAATTAPKRAS